MICLALDPGPVRSALVVYEPVGALLVIEDMHVATNDEVRRDLRDYREVANRLTVEMIASYGMPVGRDVFATCVEIGRFIEAWEGDPDAAHRTRLITRHEVKQAICHSARATDATIRQALLDRFGGKALAVGTKKAPGPLYGVHGDLWAALAVAVAVVEGA